MENARGGLLAHPWKHTKTLGTDFPLHHVSFVYGKDLVLLGGEKNVHLALQNAREENGEWRKREKDRERGNGEKEEEDRDELQRGFYEVDYALQV